MLTSRGPPSRGSTAKSAPSAVQSPRDGTDEVLGVLPAVRHGHLRPALDLGVLARGDHRGDVVRAPRPQPHPFAGQGRLVPPVVPGARHGAIVAGAVRDAHARFVTTALAS